MIEMLTPAAALGGDRIETGPGWTTWVCHLDGELIGAAQVRRCVDRTVDVVLVGGRDAPLWIETLSDMLGQWATDEGCTKLTAQGRAGWIRMLTKLGWNVTERRGRWAAYERVLA